MNKACQEFWQKCLEANPNLDPKIKPAVWHFCNTQDAAVELAKLVLSGKKTGTCSLLEAYEEGEALPKQGEYSLIIDMDKKPYAVTKLLKVEQKRFKDVGPEFAHKEGEGDQSLAYWRKVHWDFFTPHFKSKNEEPTEEMMLVCEEFKLIYPSAPASL